MHLIGIKNCIPQFSEEYKTRKIFSKKKIFICAISFHIPNITLRESYRDVCTCYYFAFAVLRPTGLWVTEKNTTRPVLVRNAYTTNIKRTIRIYNYLSNNTHARAQCVRMNLHHRLRILLKRILYTIYNYVLNSHGNHFDKIYLNAFASKTFFFFAQVQ